MTMDFYSNKKCKISSLVEFHSNTGKRLQLATANKLLYTCYSEFADAISCENKSMKARYKQKQMREQAPLAPFLTPTPIKSFHTV